MGRWFWDGLPPCIFPTQTRALRLILFSLVRVRARAHPINVFDCSGGDLLCTRGDDERNMHYNQKGQGVCTSCNGGVVLHPEFRWTKLIVVVNASDFYLFTSIVVPFARVVSSTGYTSSCAARAFTREPSRAYTIGIWFAMSFGSPDMTRTGTSK